MELGRVSVLPPDARKWAEAVSASDEEIQKISQQAEFALGESVPWRGIPLANVPVTQHEISRLEQDAKKIQVFQPYLIPGLLQTFEYAKAVMGRGESDERGVNEAVAARMNRQLLLYDFDKNIDFVILDTVLTWAPCASEHMLGQLDRIRTVSALPNVSISIIPAHPQKWVWHAHGFTLLDQLDTAGNGRVLVETLSSGLNISDPVDIQLYRDAFADLVSVASQGLEADELISGHIDRLKSDWE